MLDARAVSRFARLSLDCVHREYPNKIGHVLAGDDDVLPPRQLTPVFYGCFDWHSAVHGHWLLARLCRLYPDADFAAAARDALAQSFVADKVAGEVAYLSGEGRRAFERPYGLAWLLQLDLELAEWSESSVSGATEAKAWSSALMPLTRLVGERFASWLPKLTHPIRTGEHSQTAFAMGLVYDWAVAGGEAELASLVAERARAYYSGDNGWNLAFEPSGEDFLSPGLAEADLMRRVLEPNEFATWLGRFLPQLSAGGAVGEEPTLWPAIVSDRTDGKLAHLDGLNLSRAWMLEGIARGLPAGDARVASLDELAAVHREAGLESVTGEHYEGGHWLGSFAVYLVTRRGIRHSER